MTTTTWELEPEYQPFPNQGWRNGLQARVEIPAMAWALHLPRAQRLLEVGCGRGMAFGPLARALAPRRFAAIDIEPAFIIEARIRAADGGLSVDARVADIRALPFGDGAFDVVVDFGTSYHVAGREAALCEVARVLAPGGLFVHESPLSQAFAHPTRATWRRLPWGAAPELAPSRAAGLWAARKKRRP